MIRAFLAVELSQELRAELVLVQQELKHRIEPELKRDTRISWVQPAKIHLTIKFLGDVNEQIIDPLLGAIEQAIGCQKVVNVPLQRLGAFSTAQSTRAVGRAAGELGAGERRRGELRRSMMQSNRLVKVWVFSARQNRFSPHLTLARIKAGERHVGVALAKGGCWIDRFHWVHWRWNRSC